MTSENLCAQQSEETYFDEEINRLIDQMDLGFFKEMVPQIDAEGMIRSAAKGTTVEEPFGVVRDILRRIAGEMVKEMPSVMRTAGIAVLSAGAAVLQDGRSKMGKLCSSAAYLCAAIPLTKEFAELFSAAEESTGYLAEFSGAVMPTMIALLTACGAEKSALGLQKLSYAATGVSAELFTDVLLRLLECAAILVLLGHAMEGIPLRTILRTVRSGIHWTLSACFTLFLASLALQGTTGAHYDGVTVRIAKFAVDKSIPVVGGVFKDAADTLIGCSLVVKNAVGTAGLAGIAALTLSPCVRILSSLFNCRICAVFLEMLGSTQIGAAMNDFADILTTLFIIMISTGAMSFFLITAVMRVGLGFV